MVSNPVKIASVFSCSRDVTWRIGRARPFVPGNSRNLFERLDLIERRDPLLAAFRIRLAQMKMNIIVERIAADGQSDGRDMETGCAIGIGMPERNTYELFPFQFENTDLEFVGKYDSTTGTDACFRITAMTSLVATNRAFGNFFWIVFTPKK